MNKQEIKRAYKESKRPMGIYCIKNKEDKNIFIGFATDLNAIINRHKTELKFKSHRNKDLQKMWDSAGEASVEFKVLDELDPEEKSQAEIREELSTLADMWIQKLSSSGETVIRL